uniref:Uncharacterized protein n=1 Tax=Anguilla anguilla TaxID=7936 RepID=A0A0E9TWK7_ANGAN
MFIRFHYEKNKINIKAQPSLRASTYRRATKI